MDGAEAEGLDQQSHVSGQIVQADTLDRPG
jgi:hypothetical protein